MEDLNLEAAIWTLFTSPNFYEAAAQECELTMEWFGKCAVSKNVANFGRNNQIFDTLKTWARDFRRGAELAHLEDYHLMWETARCVRGDVRGMMEQPLHSWMTNAEYAEFAEVRINRIMIYARYITRSLNNALMKGESFFNPNPDCLERRNDDDGFPGRSIVQVYNANVDRFKESLSWSLPEPLPKYVIEPLVTCSTGEEVPSTGIWYPNVGLENHSLTFSIKGQRMQPAFQVIKSIEERMSENEGAIFSSPETVAVATVWHPVVRSGRDASSGTELWAKAGEPCPRAGIWQPADLGTPQRTYALSEVMANLGSAYGLTVWRWVSDR